MKVLKVQNCKSTEPVLVTDCFVGEGYLQGDSGSLPDVDIDYQSDRRQEVKEYIEKRYNHSGLQRVFSAGTLTTLKVKAVIKETKVFLSEVSSWKKGSFFPLDISPCDDISVLCGDVPLFNGVMGRKEDNVVVKINGRADKK